MILCVLNAVSIRILAPRAVSSYFGGFRLTDLRRPTTLLTLVITAFSLRWADRDFLSCS